MGGRGTPQQLQGCAHLPAKSRLGLSPGTVLDGGIEGVGCRQLPTLHDEENMIKFGFYIHISRYILHPHQQIYPTQAVHQPAAEHQQCTHLDCVWQGGQCWLQPQQALPGPLGKV